jgi:SAM-dependent methyltransferase
MRGRRLPQCAVLAVLLCLTGCQQGPAEKDRWNKVFSSPQPVFNSNPNAFLVEAVRGRHPGMALDLGMGQGRNALFLAQQGWAVTGVDISDVALSQARQQAERMHLKLTAVLLDAKDFDFGSERWDLVAVIYFPASPYVARIHRGLKPGGIVVMEAFHRDSGEKHRLGDGVVFGSNDLVKLFEDFRILRYEDVLAPSDWNPAGEREPARLVRLVAQK